MPPPAGPSVTRMPIFSSTRIEGALPEGVTAKDMALALIGRIGTAGATGHVIEYAGAAVRAPVEFKNARDKLMAAQTAMEKGRHERAIRSAEQAGIDAEYARARAANQRVNAMADEMNQSLKALRQELERTP